VTRVPHRAPRPEPSTGFPPIASPGARVLVCGSLPGQMSLALRQYYAQPRNAFWKITGELFGFDPRLDYAARTAALCAHGIALWDVCAAAVRPGSLDAEIRRDTVVPNDFVPFLLGQRRLRRLCFNGGTAFELFERLVVPTLPASLQGLTRIRLPSTSPAHAGMSYADKLARWRESLVLPA
jgi:hypoxanthine-DNA glycosylase